MARYIDADKIDYTVTMVGRDEYAGYRAVAFESDIDEMPAADVVEVVRCKDCKFAYICGDKVYCRNIETPWYNDYFEVFTEMTDFCSYGERIEKWPKEKD